MKALLLGIALTLPALLLGKASNIEIGQSLEETLETLGMPVGMIEMRDKTLLLYPEGEVTLRDDKVTHIDLMSEEAFAAYQEQLREEREEWQLQQERQAAARTEEGKAIKAAKMKSRAFAARPAKERVEYWRNFQSRYREVDASEEIARALESYEAELSELESQQRIAELEARIAQTEKEAANARLEAARAREETERRKQTDRYGLRYDTGPIIHRRYYYRPPTITIFTDGKHHHDDKHHFDDGKTRHNKKNTLRLRRRNIGKQVGQQLMEDGDD